jgi:hypothetical protein
MVAKYPFKYSAIRDAVANPPTGDRRGSAYRLTIDGASA